MNTNNVLCICLLFLLSSIASAHGGRTDASGCHHDRKHGGYHCHNSGTTYQNQSTQKSNNSQRNNQQTTHSSSASSTTTHTVEPQFLSIRPASSQSNKSNAPAIDKNLVLKIQSALNQLGYAAGEPDGVLGVQTIKAIKHFQVDNDMAVDGRPSYLLLDVLLGKVG